MQRNLIIGGVIAIAVLALAAVGYVTFLQNGDEIAIAQLDRIVQTYDGEYSEASYDPAQDRLVVDGLILRNYITSPEDEPLDLVEIGHLDVSGLARIDWRGVLSGGRAQNVFSALEATGIVLTEGGQAISIERFAARDVALVSAETIEVDGPARDLSRRELAARLALLFNADEVRISGFQSPGEGPTGMQFAELAIDDMRGGAVGRVSATGLSLWDDGQMGTVGDTVRLTADSVLLEGLDARVPLGRTARGEMVTFDRQSNVPLYDRFSAENISVQQERGEPLRIGAISVENDDYHGPLPTDTALAVTGLHLPLTGDLIDQQDTASLRNLGYDELIFNFRYRADYDFETQDFDLTDISLGVDDMGELQMSLQVGGVPFTEDMIDRSAEALLQDDFIAAMLQEAALRSGTMSFTDAGLFDRVVETNAEKAGQTREEYLETTLSELRAQREEVASSELAVQTIDALIAFFEDPGTLTMTMVPDEPVPVQQMVLAAQINPLILVELLNMQVTAE